MSFHGLPWQRQIRTCACVFLSLFVSTLCGQEVTKEKTARLPTYLPPAEEILARSAGHPLAGPLKYAYQTHEHLKNSIHDYTCIFSKRERSDGKIKGYCHMETKVRHERTIDETVVVPFSVYMKFLAPRRFKDRELLYVDGAYNGKLLVRQGGHVLPNLVHKLVPDGRLALGESKYPIYRFGMQNLVAGLISVMIEDLEHGECEVSLTRQVDLNGTKCTHFRVIHPTERPHFRFHRADVFLDERLRVPVYYAAYGWPREEEGPPTLIEEFAFRNVRINTHLTDKDFDRNNPNYGFGNLERILSNAE